MQNFNLLRELGHCRKPVLLKRGMASTVTELLMAAEYIMAGGNEAPTEASDLIVELAPDDNLNYEYTMDAITAVSGFSKGGRTYPLVEQIRFAARGMK